MKTGRSKKKNIAGISIRRVLPQFGCRSIGPFVFFDHIGPTVIKANDDGLLVPMHPHIHLVTCTYLFNGEILHRDSLGFNQNLMPGGVNWMFAGTGITHSERSPDHLRGKEYNIHGAQFWLALPEEKENKKPAFFHFPADQVPRWQEDLATYALLAGSYQGQNGPCPLFSETLLMHLTIPKGFEMTLIKNEEEAALYCCSGELIYGGHNIEKGDLLQLPGEHRFKIKAKSRSDFFFFGGNALGRRYLDWNFVSSSRDSISAAKNKWKMQLFPKVPGETEFTSYPE